MKQQKDTGNIHVLKPEDFERHSARYSSDSKKKREGGGFGETVMAVVAYAVHRITAKPDTEAYKRREAQAWALPKSRETNFTFIACLVLLSMIGLIMVTSSSVYFAYDNTGDSLYYFKRQLLWLAISITVMVVAVYVPLRMYRQLASVAYIAAIILLVAVLVIGVEVKGSKRWIGIGEISFQPSEFAKIATALFMAVLVDQHKDDIQDGWVFTKLLIVMLVPTILIITENLSTAIVNAAIGLMIMFIGGARIKHFMIIVLPMVALLVFIVLIPLVVPIEEMPEWIQGFMNSWYYRTVRVRAWLDPWSYASGDGYQAIQSLYAVGSGGLFGVGLGQSVQKLGFIPEAHNDIIFAVLCEELGLMGAGVVLLLFAGLIWNGIQIAVHAPNNFSSLLAVGMITQVAVQVIINVAVNTNSIPVTGVTLPFISYGGSSLLFLMGSMGILLNISRYSTAPRN